MKLSFKALLGSIPKGGQTENQVSAAGVYVKKEDKSSLITSDKLKLSQAAREGGAEQFCFLDTDGKTSGDFQTVYDLNQTVYDLNMRIEALLKTLVFIDTLDIFQIIPTATISLLEDKLTNLFTT